MNKRSASHVKVQKLGKVRDNYTCQICGAKKSIEGHHIIDFQFSGAPEIDNIISLCKKCHKNVHRGKVDLIKF